MQHRSITAKKKCRQLPVRGADVEAAFVNMINKLIYGRDAVLLPMSGKLLGGGNKPAAGGLLGSLLGGNADEQDDSLNGTALLSALLSGRK